MTPNCNLRRRARSTYTQQRTCRSSSAWSSAWSSMPEEISRHYSTSSAPADPPAPGPERDLLLHLRAFSCAWTDSSASLPLPLLGMRAADATHDAKTVARLPTPRAAPRWRPQRGVEPLTLLSQDEHEAVRRLVRAEAGAAAAAAKALATPPPSLRSHYLQRIGSYYSVPKLTAAAFE